MSPEVIFDARPGELFVVRNVANLVPPFETGGTYHGVSAALEFGVGVLKVKHIVMLGHAQCGGVQSLCRGCRADLARRFHRPVDVADGAGRREGRPAWRMSRAEYIERMEKARSSTRSKT